MCSLLVLGGHTKLCITQLANKIYFCAGYQYCSPLFSCSVPKFSIYCVDQNEHVIISFNRLGGFTFSISSSVSSLSPGPEIIENSIKVWN